MKFLLVALLGMSAVGAWADDDSTSTEMNKSTLQIPDLIRQKEYEQSQKISDMELNAQTGSLSRYSMQAVLGYNGPAVNDLTSTTQPNPLHKEVPSQTDVSGTVGIRYRVSSDDTFYFSTGVLGYFQPDGQKNPDAENPSAEYDHSYKVGGVQMYTGITAEKTTTSYYLGKGETAGAILKQYMKYNIPNSQFILGTELEVAQWFYSRDYRKSDGTGLTDAQYYVIPSLEYKISHNFNLNTSYSTGFAHYRGVDATGTYSGYPGAWWVGFGYGITRDIYVKPYLAFYPQAMTWSQTALAMSTYISIF